MLAIAACASLLAATACTPMADGARTERLARARLAHTAPQTPSATMILMENTLHTYTARRNDALSLILHMIAARAPGCVIDVQMHRAATILTMCCDPESMAAPLHTTREVAIASTIPASMIFASAAQHTCPDLDVPDLECLTPQRALQQPHTATRPHIPDGPVPDGGHPRLCRETLPTTNIISYLQRSFPREAGTCDTTRPANGRDNGDRQKPPAQKRGHP